MGRHLARLRRLDKRWENEGIWRRCWSMQGSWGEGEVYLSSELVALKITRAPA